MKFEITRSLFYKEAICICGNKPSWSIKPLIEDEAVEPPYKTFVCSKCIGPYLISNKELFEIEEEAHLKLFRSMEKINNEIRLEWK